MSSFNQRGCFGCRGPLDGLLCRQCTCKWCGNNLRNGYCSIYDSGARNSFVYDPNLNSFNDPRNFFNHPPQPQAYSCELCGNDSYYGYDCPPRRMNDVYNKYNDMIESRNELLKTMQSLGEMLRQREQAANLSTHTLEPSRRFNSICYDDEESTIPLNENISQISPFIAITPVLPTMKPEDSLIMGDEDLHNILAKESDKFKKSSVEDLVPIPRESKDTSDSDKECDLPFCDNTEDVQEENFKKFLNPLFEFDDKYISSDVNPIFNEVLEDIETKDSYVSNLDKPSLLVTPIFDANEDECFDPGGDIDKIYAFLDIDVSTNIKDGYHDSEGDINPRSLKDEPDNDDLKSMVKVFDPEIHEKIISLTYVSLPFEDRHYFSLTFFIRIFLPYLTYSMDSSLHFSSGSEDTIFDPGIFVFSFYSLELMVSHRSGTFMCSNVYLNILNEKSIGDLFFHMFRP
nr:hypothetical protein [Tanacetum cinerariifolium]